MNPIRNTLAVFRLGLKAYVHALYILFKYYYVLIAGSILVTLLFFPALQVVVRSYLAEQKQINPWVSLMFVVATVLWFLVQAHFFVAIQDQHSKYNVAYYRYTVFRYIQILLLFSLLLLLGVVILTGFGIVRFPKFHWSLTYMLRYFATLIVFYWLASRHRFIDFFKSCEDGANLFVYNIVYVVLIFGLSVACNFVLAYGMQKLFGVQALELESFLLHDRHDFYFNQEYFVQLSSVMPYLVVKLIKLFVDFFFVSLLYGLFLLKHEVRYAPGLFESES